MSDTLYQTYKDNWVGQLNPILKAPISWDVIQNLLLRSMAKETWEFDEYIEECFPADSREWNIDLANYILDIRREWLYFYTAEFYGIDCNAMQNFVVENGSGY